jgi:hydrogenase maturation protease
VALVRVIGCGNPDAGDDAVGILAVAGARVSLEALPGVEVIPRASPLEVVHLLEGADAVLVVDAIRTPGGGRTPGSVVRAEAGPQGLPAEIRSSLSSHGLGVAEAVGLAAAIGLRTPRVVVLGVEAQAASAGQPLSQAVSRALPQLTDLVVAEARTLAAEAERSPASGPTDPIRADGEDPR